jgi:type II secretory pathway predicted ATPase ExeA
VTAATDLDPAVELLPDVPVAHPDEDLLARAPVARRLVELACAQPAATPRAVAVVGAAGAGKTSVLNLATGMLSDRSEVALVALDGADHAGAEALHGALVAQLTAFFAAAGVVDATDVARDKLAGYGDLVSGIARVAGVKLDVSSAVRRSAEDVRAELAEMAHEVGKRLVITVDHLDRLPIRELAATLRALRHYASIPYVAIVLALDRRTTARRLAEEDLDADLVERLVSVELALPPADRVLLARVLAGGLGRAAARLGKNVDAVLPLFDPDAREESFVLDLVETPRDAKRVVNALTAALPLLPEGADLQRTCLELVLRMLVPEIDVAHLSWQLEPALRGHRHEHAARAALRSLVE